jgi:hypothetical protein
MSPAIEVDNLAHRFGAVPALRGVTFTVHGGEIFGLLGPNGAGETTTIRVLLTLLKPRSGQARVAGLDVVAEPDAVRRSVGWVPQERAVDPLLTARENLRFIAGLYHLPTRRLAPAPASCWRWSAWRPMRTGWCGPRLRHTPPRSSRPIVRTHWTRCSWISPAAPSARRTRHDRTLGDPALASASGAARPVDRAAQGWPAAEPVRLLGYLLVFDLLCIGLATAVLRRGLR